MEELIDIKRTKKQLNTLLLVLLADEEYSLLPELYQIFGEETLLEFLDVFGGVELKVPRRNHLLRSIRDVAIYHRLEKSNKPTVVNELASEYDISPETVKRIHLRISQVVRDNKKVFVKLVKDAKK